MHFACVSLLTNLLHHQQILLHQIPHFRTSLQCVCTSEQAKRCSCLCTVCRRLAECHCAAETALRCSSGPAVAVCQHVGRAVVDCTWQQDLSSLAQAALQAKLWFLCEHSLPNTPAFAVLLSLLPGSYVLCGLRQAMLSFVMWTVVSHDLHEALLPVKCEAGCIAC